MYKNDNVVAVQLLLGTGCVENRFCFCDADGCVVHKK